MKEKKEYFRPTSLNLKYYKFSIFDTYRKNVLLTMKNSRLKIDNEDKFS